MTDPVSASLQACRAYWALMGLRGNRAEAQRAADEAFNAAVVNGPESWRAAYPLRPLGT